MADFISLTYLENNKPAALYINVDQICQVRHAVASTYPTMLGLSTGAVYVQETVSEVMKLITQANGRV